MGSWTNLTFQGLRWGTSNFLDWETTNAIASTNENHLNIEYYDILEILKSLHNAYKRIGSFSSNSSNHWNLICDYANCMFKMTNKILQEKRHENMYTYPIVWHKHRAKKLVNPSLQKCKWTTIEICLQRSQSIDLWDSRKNILSNFQSIFYSKICFLMRFNTKFVVQVMMIKPRNALFGILYDCSGTCVCLSKLFSLGGRSLHCFVFL